jgi:hypothetical protein
MNHGVAAFMALRGEPPAFFFVAERPHLARFSFDGEYLGHEAGEPTFAILTPEKLEERRAFAYQVNEESEGEEGIEITVIAAFTMEQAEAARRAFEHFDPTGERAGEHGAGLEARFELIKQVYHYG